MLKVLQHVFDTKIHVECIRQGPLSKFVSASSTVLAARGAWVI